MAGRTKPNWAVFDGGPFNGKRELLPAQQLAGTLIVYTPSDGPGMRVPHEYLITSEYRSGGFHEAKGRVVRYMRTLPPESAPVLDPSLLTPPSSFTPRRLPEAP